MTVAPLDPRLIHSDADIGRATEVLPDAMDIVIAKINELVSGAGVNGLLSIPGIAYINLVGSHDDVDLWSGGPRSTHVEVDLVGGSGATITGIAAGTEGDMLLLWNGGGGSVPIFLTLKSQSASSLSVNRIWVANGKDLHIPNNDGVWLKYVGDSWIVFGGATTMVRAQELSLESAVEPAALGNGSSTNDYDPWLGTSVGSHVRQDTGLASTITGLAAAGAPNSEGRIVVFANISTTGTITVKHNSGSSSGVNRVLCPNGSDVVLGPLCCATFVYDLNVGIWRIVSVTGQTTGTRQTFRVTRQAGDTDTITVDGARGFTARANANYNVHGTMGQNTNSVGVQSIVPIDASSFTLQLTAAWTVGDYVMLTVENLP